MVILFHGISQGNIEAKRFTNVNIAAKTAVRASLEDESWDLAATANAGTIILDETKVAQIALDRFLANQNMVGSADIYVINSAPFSFVNDGLSHQFQHNGVALIYELDGRKWLRAAEVDDY